MKLLGKLISITLCVLLLLLTIETFSFEQYRPATAVSQSDNETSLSWQRLPYPAYYEIEVLSRLPDTDSRATPRAFRLMRFRTFDNQMTLSQDFPFQTYWRVSAIGLFKRPLGRWSEPVAINSPSVPPAVDFTTVKPKPTATMPAEKAVGQQPILLWTTVPGAVYYEIEFLSKPPENPNGIELSVNRVFVSRGTCRLAGGFPNRPHSQGSEFPWCFRREGKPSHKMVALAAYTTRQLSSTAFQDVV